MSASECESVRVCVQTRHSEIGMGGGCRVLERVYLAAVPANVNKLH